MRIAENARLVLVWWALAPVRRKLKRRANPSLRYHSKELKSPPTSQPSRTDDSFAQSATLILRLLTIFHTKPYVGANAIELLSMEQRVPKGQSSGRLRVNEDTWIANGTSISF